MRLERVKSSCSSSEPGSRSETPSPDRQRDSQQSVAQRALLIGLVDLKAEPVDLKAEPEEGTPQLESPVQQHSDVLERLEVMDFKKEEVEEMMSFNPKHVRIWVRRLEDRAENDRECSLDNAWDSDSNHALNPSTAESVPNITSVALNVRPTTSGETETLPPDVDGSDLDSEFDDEFDGAPIETTAVFTGGRDIPEEDYLEEHVRDVTSAVESAMDDEADRMLGVSSSYIWEEGFETFKGIPEPFSGDTPGPRKDYDTPYDSFIEIWDKDIIGRIVQETNRYAKQTIDGMKSKGTLKPLSRLHKWIPTDADEIMTLFAVYMFMAIDPRTSQIEYWMSGGFLEMPNFKKIMTYNRYVLLSKFLHFVDNSVGSVVENSQQNEEVFSPKLAKLKPVITHLNSKFSTVYNLTREISIDESLTLFKGRLSWVQTISTNAARIGIKSYELCESRTGYMYKFQIYAGKNYNFSDASSADLGGKSAKVVLDLLKGLENLGHCVTMDNFYNCPALARYLKSLGFDCLGTLRVNRRHVPDDIAKVPKNVAKGTIISRQCGDVSVVAWRDSKVVTMISTYHNADTYVGSRAGRLLVKPVCVRDYQNTMAGIDLKDQKLSMYLMERKSGMKWYVMIFKRLLNVSIYNAFIMYVGSLRRRNKLSVTHREYRYSLVNALVLKHRPCLQEISQPVGQLMRLRKDVTHIPKYKSGPNNRKRCHLCQQKKVEKKVRSQCVTCGVYMCFDPCWNTWHNLVELKADGGRGRKRRRVED